MNNGTENLEWAKQEVKELASKENRQIGHISFNLRSDVVELVIESRGQKISQEFNEAEFREDMRPELQKLLKMTVKRIK